MPSPKAEPVVLTDEEHSVLLGWSRRRKTAQALALRARIILACAEGGTNGEVAERLGVGRQTVSKWRARFLVDRLDGLADEPRPGRPRVIGDEQIEALITKTLEEAPANGDTHWSTRSMAAQTGLNQTAVSRIWRAFGLKPHAVQSWKLSTDPLFVDKGPRRRRPLHGSAAERPGAGGRREKQHPGPRPQCPDPADAAHHTRADEP